MWTSAVHVGPCPGHLTRANLLENPVSAGFSSGSVSFTLNRIQALSSPTIGSKSSLATIARSLESVSVMSLPGIATITTAMWSALQTTSRMTKIERRTVTSTAPSAARNIVPSIVLSTVSVSGTSGIRVKRRLLLFIPTTKARPAQPLPDLHP